MLKARKLENSISVYDSKQNDSFNFDFTTWEIMQIIKHHGKDESIQKIMKLFDIDEKNAREDVETILKNLKILKLKIEEIPIKISTKKYAPRSVHFDITTICNSKCIYCYATDRLYPRQELSTEQILKLLHELAELDIWTIMISGGEPFLKKDFIKILEHINKLEIIVSILTNGTLITEDISRKLASFNSIQMIQVSLDSYVREHHEFHRGEKGTFDKTLNGIKNLIKYGITPNIEIVVTPNNVDDIEKTIEFLNNLKIKKITIGPAFTNTGRAVLNKTKLIFDEESLKFIAKKIMKLKEKYKGSMCINPNREFLIYAAEKPISVKELKCGVGKSILYISPDGLVYPCLFSVYPESYLGDIKKESLKDIWEKSDILKRYRTQNIPDIQKCSKCDFRSIYDLISK